MKLGRLHFMLFAARSYLDAYGTPTSIADLKDHRLIAQSNDDGGWEESYRRVFGDLSPDGLLVLRNNSSAGHFWSVIKGAGIGAVPTYAQAIGANLVSLDIGLDRENQDIWLVYHPDAKRVSRIQRTIEWLIQCYDPRRYPWFRDEFIHPDRYPALYKGEPLSGALTDFWTAS